MINQVPKLTHQEFLALLKQKGLKLTQARSELAAVLIAFHKPFTAEEVVERIHLHGAQVHRATIYRDLHLFEKARILNELVFQGATAHYYELASSHHHHHFVCQSCFMVVDVFPTKIEHTLVSFEQELSTRGLSVSHHHLKFYGLCSDCQEKETSPS